MSLKLNNLSPILVFIFSSFVIIFNLLSLVFPALILRLSSGAGLAPISLSPYELGVFALPLLAINSIFFCLFFLYKKNLLPIFNSILKFLGNFDLSNRNALLILFLIVGVYSAFTFSEIFEDESWADKKTVINQFDTWHSKDIEFDFVQLHTKMILLTISEELFDNFRVIPFLGSISLLILTYFFTVQLSSKKISGLIAVVIVIQSYIFRLFDTSFTYSNFWILFYLLSLYLVKKGWPFSFLSFIASVFAKPLTLAYLPLTIFHIFSSSTTTKKKLLTLFPYFVIIIIAGIFILQSEVNDIAPGNLSFHPQKFLSGFSIFPFQLRFDIFVTMLLMPLNFLLFVKSRQGQKYAQSLQILISGILLTGPFLVGFFDMLLNPYRLIPMIIFFSIAFGFLFGKNQSSKINCQ